MLFWTEFPYWRMPYRGGPPHGIMLAFQKEIISIRRSESSNLCHRNLPISAHFQELFGQGWGEGGGSRTASFGLTAYNWRIPVEQKRFFLNLGKIVCLYA